MITKTARAEGPRVSAVTARALRSIAVHGEGYHFVPGDLGSIDELLQRLQRRGLVKMRSGSRWFLTREGRRALAAFDTAHPGAS